MSEDLSLSYQDSIILPQKQEKFKRMFLVMVVVLLVVVGLVFAGIIKTKSTSPDWLLQKNVPTIVAKPTETLLTPTPDETVNWKTYEDTSFGFSVKLPLDLNVLNEDTKRVEFATVPPMTRAALTITSQLTNFNSIDICSEKTMITPCINSDLWDKKQKGISDKKLAGVNAKEFIIWSEVGREEKIIQTTKPQIELRFWYNDPGYSDNLYNQILSTFKFTTNDENCIAEGGKGNYTKDLRCCQGLAEITYPSSNPPCSASESIYFSCYKCGDGKCGNGETKCNCPSDCF